MHILHIENEYVGEAVRVKVATVLVSSGTMALNANQMQRYEWQVGQQCEIYNHAQQKWIKAKVIDIFKDEEGEWVKVKYEGKRVEFPSNSPEIRPFSDENTNRLEKWKKGAQCELFSRTKGEWVDAQIINVFSDEEGDWLRVQHDQRVRDVFGSHIDHDIRERGAISTTVSVDDMNLLKQMAAKNRAIAPILQRIFAEKDELAMRTTRSLVLFPGFMSLCV